MTAINGQNVAIVIVIEKVFIFIPWNFTIVYNKTSIQ